MLLLLGTVFLPIVQSQDETGSTGVVLPTLPVVEDWTPEPATLTPWLPIPDVNVVGAGSIVAHGSQALAWLDVGRATPRVFDLTYRYVAPATSLTGEGRIEIGLTPTDGDESEAWIQVDGGLARALLGIEIQDKPKFIIDKPHEEGFLVQSLPDATGDLIEDYLVRIPHFSTPWITITDGSKAFQALWGTSANDIWAVGDHRIYHKGTGSAFEDKTPIQLRDNSPGALYTVVGSSSSLVFAAGDYGKIWRYTGGDYQTGWAPYPNPNPFNLPDPSKLFIKGSTYADGLFWFVGVDLNSGFCYVGCKAFIGWHNPSTGNWGVENLNGLQGDLRAIWQGPFGLWAMGQAADNIQDESLVLRHEIFYWNLIQSSGQARLATHGASSDHAYAVGTGGDIWRFNSFYWTLDHHTTDNVIYTVRAPHADVAWAGGCENACQAIHQKVLGVWADVPVTTTLPILSMWSSGLKDVWAVGSGGLIMHYQGAPPRAPVLSSPAHGQTNANPSSLTLVAESSVDPDLDPVTGYNFYITTNYALLQPGGSPPAPWMGCNDLDLTCTISGLMGNTYHYWRVDACDASGCTAGQIRNFKTAPAATACIRSAIPTNLRLDVNGDCSSDGGAGGLTLDWDWGDGTAHGSGLTASHTYTTLCPNGSPTIRLTVTNSAGATSSSQKPVTVEDLRNADAGPDPQGRRDLLVRCREDSLGTSDNDFDSDDDGLFDHMESEWWDEFPGVGAGTRNAVFCNNNAQCPEEPNATRRDLYVEMDAMSGHPLRTADRTTIVNAFTNAPVNTNGPTTDDVRFHLDTGTNGGGGEVLPFDQWLTEDEYNQNQQNHLDARRDGVYRYGIVACRDDADRLIEQQGFISTTFGWGTTPGDTFAIFNCTDDPRFQGHDMAEVNAQAKQVLHELGHTITGIYFHDLAECQNTLYNGQPVTLRDNRGLGHFADDLWDCQNNGDNDASGHPVDPNNDVLTSGRPAEVPATTYSGTTWAAVKLDYGIDGSLINNCGFHRDTPYTNAPPDLLGLGDSSNSSQCNGASIVPRPCESPLVGIEPNCSDPSQQTCPPPMVGTPPDCAAPTPEPCPVPLVGIWPDCMEPAPPCPAGEVGLTPACAPPPQDCSNSGDIGAEDVCASICAPPTVGVTVAGTLRCLSPPEPCPLPTVGVGSICQPTPQGCPSGSVGVVWYGVASTCEPLPQLCSLPGIGVEPTCVTACAPPQLGLVVGEFVVCVPPPQLCPPGSFGVEWDPSFQVTACFSLCSGGTAGVEGIVCVNPHSKCADFPDLAMVCVVECAAGEVGAEPVCFDPCSLVVGDCPPQLCPLTEPGVEPNCVDPDDPCSLLPMPSSATLVGVDCVGLCSPPRVGIVVGDRAVCLNPPTVPSCIGTALVCFNPQTRCIQSSTALNNICLPNPF